MAHFISVLGCTSLVKSNFACLCLCLIARCDYHHRFGFWFFFSELNVDCFFQGLDVPPSTSSRAITRELLQREEFLIEQGKRTRWRRQRSNRRRATGWRSMIDRPADLLHPPRVTIGHCLETHGIHGARGIRGTHETCRHRVVDRSANVLNPLVAIALILEAPGMHGTFPPLVAIGPCPETHETFEMCHHRGAADHPTDLPQEDSPHPLDLAAMPTGTDQPRRSARRPRNLQPRRRRRSWLMRGPNIRSFSTCVAKACTSPPRSCALSRPPLPTRAARSTSAWPGRL